MSKWTLSLKQWVSAVIEIVGCWLLELADKIYTPPEPFDLVLLRAVTLVRHQDSLRPQSGLGESKRHQVYAQLIKDFPHVSKRQISRSIEDAIDAVIAGEYPDLR